MTAVPIECRGLTKFYGTHVGAQDVDLVVPERSITGFLGPNGAGKSTVLRMLVGLLVPTSGEALLWGRPALAPESRAAVGYMPADPAFYGALSGEQNLELFADLHGRGAPDRAWALETLELPASAARRPVGEYSSGMAQKLALVQAVQHRPDLVILDEPANRLDPLAHRRFEEMLKAIAARGGTVLLSSHTLSEVEAVCDRVAMLRSGRLLEVRAVDELAAVALRRVRATFDGPPPSPPEGLTDVQVAHGELSGRMPRGRLDVLHALLAAPGLTDITVEPGSLEEAFVELYEGHA